MSWNQLSCQQPTQQEPIFAVPELRDERVGTFLAKVYGWMFLGLMISAGTAFTVSSSPAPIEAFILKVVRVTI